MNAFSYTVHTNWNNWDSLQLMLATPAYSDLRHSSVSGLTHVFNSGY